MLVVSVVPYANGSRTPRASGIVATGDIPNTFLTAAEWCGIRSILVASVRVVVTSGVGRRVCGAKVGRYTKIGMPRNDLRRNPSPTALNSDKIAHLDITRSLSKLRTQTFETLGLVNNEERNDILCGYQVRF